MSALAPISDNARQVAAALLAIDGRKAARILGAMTPEQLEPVKVAIAELRQSPVDPAMAGSALATVAAVVVSTSQATRRTLQDVVPSRREETAEPTDPATDSKSGTAEADGALAFLGQVDAQDVAALLADEHPQIVAIVLTRIGRKDAADVLRAMPATIRSELLHRVATLDRVPPGVVERIAGALSRKVEDLGFTTARPEPLVSVQAAAEILKHLGDEDEVLAPIDAEIAASIRDELITFEDLAHLDRRSMQRLLGFLDTKTLALALKINDAEVEANVFDNLSKRAHDMVTAMRDRLGPTRLSVAQAAQQRILKTVRELILAGHVRKPYDRAERLV